MTRFEVPIRHGEGKFIPRDDALLDRLAAQGQLAVRYALPGGGPANGAYPANPNGSIGDVAGLCDATGRIFGLMPHPEAFVTRHQHPRWTREELPEEGAGLQVFKNAVEYVSAAFQVQC
jgi:phosphoribosylformylglycinamidine synthase